MNQLTLVVPGSLPGSAEEVYLDWFEITYRQVPQAVSDRLAFQIDGSGRRDFQIAAFEGQNIVAYDVTDPTAPINLLNVQITSGSAEGETPAVAPTFPTDQPRRAYLPLIGNVLSSTG